MNTVDEVIPSGALGNPESAGLLESGHDHERFTKAFSVNFSLFH